MVGRRSLLGQFYHLFSQLSAQSWGSVVHKATSHGFPQLLLHPNFGELIFMKMFPFQEILLRLGKDGGTPNFSGHQRSGIFITSLDIITLEYNFMNFLIC